jgi:inactivated superfamily I helicase
MPDDYEVGYGKPPTQHRFQAGNQAARKKGRSAKKRETVVTLASVVEDVMRAKRKAKRGDAVISLNMGEFLRERLIQMIMAGSSRDVLNAIQIMDRLMPQAPARESEPLEVYLHRAEGSQVALPPSHLWEGEGS